MTHDILERLRANANGNPVLADAIAEIERLRKLTQGARPKVFIALPAYGQMVTAQTTSTLVDIIKTFTEQQMLGGFGTLSFPSIMELRNLFLSVWYYKIQTSHMLMIDNDMQFSTQLIMDMLAFDKPVVGALCPKRKLPLEFAGRAKPGECRVINNFLEVDGVGGAILMIKREAIDAMIVKHPEILDTKSIKGHAAKQLMEEQGITTLIRGFDEMKVDGEHFSEDLSFCKRAQACGFDIWANIGHEVTHVGPYEFKARYLDMIKDQIKQTSVPVEQVGIEAAGGSGGPVISVPALPTLPSLHPVARSLPRLQCRT